jgi:hypothetical protein
MSFQGNAKHTPVASRATSGRKGGPTAGTPRPRSNRATGIGSKVGPVGGTKTGKMC